MHNSTPKVAIVFATDEAYFGLSKDLVCSIIESTPPEKLVELICIDVGLGENSLSWMTQNNVSIHAAKIDRLPKLLQQIVAARPYMMAQFYRPYIPEIAPDADLIIHIDCDAWVQNSEFLDVCINAVRDNPGKILLAVGSSHYNTPYYDDIQATLEMQKHWTFGCYEKPVADKLSKMAFFSSGVFAASPDSAVWKRWEAEIARIVPLVAMINPSVLHLAEQTALNGVIRMDSSGTVLDPLFNFHCNAGGVRRDENTGKVISAMVHPNREIGIVHLADWKRRRDYYIESKLIFRPESPPLTF